MQDDRDLLDEQDLEAWDLEPAPLKEGAGLRLPLLIVLAGVFLLIILAVLDGWAIKNQEWGGALLYDKPLPIEEEENILPVMLRRLPEPRSPLIEWLEEMPEGQEVIKQLRLDKGEWVVLLPVSDQTLVHLLASGRIPSRGRFEAVAGDLARGNSFQLNGHEFHVVGRLKRSVGGLAFTFIVPDDEAYRPLFQEDGARQGWLDLNGRERLASLPPEVAKEWPEPVGAMTRAGKGVPMGVILGMVLVALGGSVTYYRIFLRMRTRRPARTRQILEEVHDRPGLFWGMHVLMYGAFFTMMVLATAYPLVTMRMEQYLSQQLTEGSMKHVGAAYASGDILFAAAVTFAHNYFLATIIQTFAISLVIPFGGVIKNLLTFLAVGFAMAPLWAGSAAGMSFHSITMAVELGAYIVASFAVAVFWIRIGRGIFAGTFRDEFLKGLKALGGAAILSAVMLAVAALYEATTLILLG